MLIIQNNCQSQIVMGNKFTSPKSPSPELVEEIEEKRYYELIASHTDRRVVDVNLATETADDTWRHNYFVVVDGEIPKDHYLILLFPNHQEPDKQVLYTNQYSSLAKLNNEINDRLCASLVFTDKAHDLRLAVICGNQLYRMIGLQGTVFLYWAEKINRTTINQIKNTVDQFVPLLFEMDGSMRGRSFCILQPFVSQDEMCNGYLESIPYVKCEFTFPRNQNFFTYETKPEEDIRKHVRTMSREQVMKRVEREIEHSRGSVDDEELPFDDSSDEAYEVRDDFNPNGLSLSIKLDKHVRSQNVGFEPPVTLSSASISDEGTPREIPIINDIDDINIFDQMIEEDNSEEEVLNNTNNLNPLVYVPDQNQ